MYVLQMPFASPIYICNSDDVEGIDRIKHFLDGIPKVCMSLDKSKHAYF